MNLLTRLARRDNSTRYSWSDYQADLATAFTFGGNRYLVQPTWGGPEKGEPIDGTFTGFARGAYKANGVVFACILARLLMFAEVRFAFRRRTSGRVGDLFTTSALAPLETPWPGGTTGELLARMEQDASLSGNFFAIRQPSAYRSGESAIVRLNPQHVTIATTARLGPTGQRIGYEIIGYMYREPDARDAELFPPEQVCHYSPLPDPEASYRGMSWISTVLDEIAGDKLATRHKIKFFEHAATPNMVVSLAPEVSAQDFEQFVSIMRERHEGVNNAYKTLFLGGGADVRVVGANFEQMDFKAVQGAGETRIAAAAGVPPVIVGLSEGLAASTYSNYAQARRRFVDMTIRPLWRIAAASLARLIDVPPGAELWYDDREIAALREDAREAADIRSVDARTIRTLIDAGYDADAVLVAVTTGDFTALRGQHSGLFSVQLQPPTTATPNDNDDDSEGEDA